MKSVCVAALWEYQEPPWVGRAANKGFFLDGFKWNSVCGRTGEEILFQTVMKCRLQLNSDFCCYLSKLAVVLEKEWTNQFTLCAAALAILALSVLELEEGGYASLSLCNYKVVISNSGKS